MPEPVSRASRIKLSGLSGPPGKRFALINGSTFTKGETANVKVDGKSVKVHCVDIMEHSVLVEIEGEAKPRELGLAAGR